MDPITAITAATALFNLALKWKQELQQRGEWTPEQDAAFDLAAEEAFASDAWTSKT